MMKCHWLEKWVEFEINGATVKLQGITDFEETRELQEISVDKVEKRHKGNEIWATVVLEKSQEVNQGAISQQIQSVLQQFEDVFQEE